MYHVFMFPPLKLARAYCFFMVLVGLVFQAAGADSIVINEIHYNPDVKTEPAEFVELYNPSPIAVNLSGASFTNAWRPGS